ncbi:MAG: hypothetical protein OEM42_03155 [Deltaproteobacteria bacterium]|nr:hypothetical protein [Deltaproteobacteria bacterium]MDH3383040.1 hypothetical protein [Deltaproteobacteria bacterium]
MMLEYMEKIVMFKETAEGLTADMEWLNEAGREGWELVSAIPLIAPNRDGIAYGTVGSQMILKRQMKVL